VKLECGSPELRDVVAGRLEPHIAAAPTAPAALGSITSDAQFERALDDVDYRTAALSDEAIAHILDDVHALQSRRIAAAHALAVRSPEYARERIEAQLRTTANPALRNALVLLLEKTFG